MGSIDQHQRSSYGQREENGIVPVCSQLQNFLRRLMSLGINHNLYSLLQGFEQNENRWTIFSIFLRFLYKIYFPRLYCSAMDLFKDVHQLTPNQKTDIIKVEFCTMSEPNSQTIKSLTFITLMAYEKIFFGRCCKVCSTDSTSCRVNFKPGKVLIRSIY